MVSKVNLDALIRREDFEIEDTSGAAPGTLTTTIRLEDLKRDAFFFSALYGNPTFKEKPVNGTLKKLLA